MIILVPGFQELSCIVYFISYRWCLLVARAVTEIGHILKCIVLLLTLITIKQYHNDRCLFSHL